MPVGETDRRRVRTQATFARSKLRPLLWGRALSDHLNAPPWARRGRHWGVALLCASAGLLGAACGTGGSPSANSARTTRPNHALTTSAPTTSATSDPSAAVVLAAYRAGWSAFEHALSDANPEDPALVATMVDPQLQSVKANLVADQRQGMVGRGTTTLHPKITALSASSATVVDCAYSTAELVYQATGKPVPPVTPPENDGVTSTVVLTGGTWKVYKQTVTDGKCAPGS
jgi:hypothetical protein